MSEGARRYLLETIERKGLMWQCMSSLKFNPIRLLTLSLLSVIKHAKLGVGEKDKDKSGT